MFHPKFHIWLVSIIASVCIVAPEVHSDRVHQYPYGLKKACEDECGHQDHLEAEKSGTMLCEFTYVNIMSPCVNECLSKKNRARIDPTDKGPQRDCWCEFCKLNPEKSQFFCKGVGTGLSKSGDCVNTACNGKGDYIYHHFFCLSEHGIKPKNDEDHHED